MSAEQGHKPARDTSMVEVAWSPAPRDVRLQRLSLAAGATVADALRATGWPELQAPPEADTWTTAVWGRTRPLTYLLRDGDRVEVLRNLCMAPMEARRLRCEAAGGVKALRRRRAAAVKRR